MRVGKVGEFDRSPEWQLYPDQSMYPVPLSAPSHNLALTTNVDQTVNHCGARLVGSTVHPTRDFRLSSNVER